MSATIEHITPEEYLALEEKAETKSEYINGEIVPMVGGSFAHAVIPINIAGVLKNLPLIEMQICSSDIKIKSALETYRYADLSVVSIPPEFAIGRSDVIVNPIVIFEVLSPSTEAVDRGEKFNEYRTIESLQAYVLVSQNKRLIECLTPQNDRSWKHTFSDADAIEIPPLNCSLKLNDVYHQVTFDTSST